MALHLTFRGIDRLSKHRRRTVGGDLLVQRQQRRGVQLFPVINFVLIQQYQRPLLLQRQPVLLLLMLRRIALVAFLFDARRLLGGYSGSRRAETVKYRSGGANSVWSMASTESR